MAAAWAKRKLKAKKWLPGAVAHVRAAGDGGEAEKGKPGHRWKKGEARAYILRRRAAGKESTIRAAGAAPPRRASPRHVGDEGASTIALAGRHSAMSHERQKVCGAPAMALANAPRRAGRRAQSNAPREEARAGAGRRARNRALGEAVV